MKNHFFLGYLSICIGAFLAISTQFGQEILAKSSPRNTSNTTEYNSFDTTNEAQTPGGDVQTLRIRSGQNISYSKDKTAKNENYYYGDEYVFDSSIYQNQMVIKHVQEELNQRGFVSGAPDGVIGPRTFDALSKFQLDNGLKSTGELNQQTLDALELELVPAEVIDEQLYSE